MFPINISFRFIIPYWLPGIAGTTKVGMDPVPVSVKSSSIIFLLSLPLLNCALNFDLVSRLAFFPTSASKTLSSALYSACGFTFFLSFS